MPKTFEEGFLTFVFDDEWLAVKYDEHPDYRGRIRNLPETKAVDFAAIGSGNALFLIEVKDFRGHRIENRDRLRDDDLAIEVAQKVRDTIAGIIAAHHRGNVADWERFAQRLLSTDPPVRVLLWLEEDIHAGPLGRSENRASVLVDRLKRHLRWLTTKVFVTNLASANLKGVQVSNQPGAGQG
ncbi:hypothetical protein ACYOEI_08875 [Singulisphaera rosea]